MLVLALCGKGDSAEEADERGEKAEEGTEGESGGVGRVIAKSLVSMRASASKLICGTVVKICAPPCCAGFEWSCLQNG